MVIEVAITGIDRELLFLPCTWIMQLRTPFFYHLLGPEKVYFSRLWRIRRKLLFCIFKKLELFSLRITQKLCSSLYCSFCFSLFPSRRCFCQCFIIRYPGSVCLGSGISSDNWHMFPSVFNLSWNFVHVSMTCHVL